VTSAPALRLSALFAIVLLSPPILLSFAAPAPPTEETGAGLTELERRGKQIYVTGESPSEEPVVALMGKNAIEVPASTLPCAGCHGRDGRGKPEGGVTPTDLTWESLTKPYGVRHESGRKHPPYTPSLLKRAIAMGVDPAGQELHTAMPRYRMSLEDMEALVAYMRKLGADPDPGIDEKTLHLATLLPPEGVGGGVGEAIESVLQAFVTDLNEGGGLYGRRLVLHTHRLAFEPERRREGVAAFLDETPVFAMVGAFIAGSDESIPELLAEREIPLVGPFTLHPQTGFPLNRHVFYVLSGLATQGRVLVDFAAERHAAEGEPPSRPGAAVLFPPGNELEQVAEAMAQQAEEHDWELLRLPVAMGSLDGEVLAQRLSAEEIEVLFLLHPQAVRAALLEALPPVDLLLPGAFASPGLFTSPAAAAGRLYLSFPTLPADQSPQAVESYGRLAETHGLPRQSLTTQLTTLAAAQVLVEGLKQAGRDLSREKLIEVLEEFYEFRSGLTPPITYNPNRRIGALGAYVVTVDAERRSFEPLGSFRQPAD